jgi:hypothetical protein
MRDMYGWFMVLNATFNKTSLMEETTDLPKVTDKNILKIPKREIIIRKSKDIQYKVQKKKGQGKKQRSTKYCNLKIEQYAPH